VFFYVQKFLGTLWGHNYLTVDSPWCRQTAKNSHRIAGTAWTYKLNNWRHSARAAANFCKHRTKSIPSNPNCFVADLNASFMQKIFHVTKWERETNIQHRSQTNDLGARFKVPEWGVFCHWRILQIQPARLNRV